MTDRKQTATVFLSFLRLGVIAFGGPPAHFGFYREEFVARRGWLTERAYAELIALCSSLPGATSTQVCIAIGTMRAGWLGGVVAFIGFATPAIVLMLAAAFGVLALGEAVDHGFLNGLKVAALVIVARAVYGMAMIHSTGAVRGSLSALAAVGVLAWANPFAPITSIACGAVIGLVFLRSSVTAEHAGLPSMVSRRFANINLLLLGGLLLALPAVAELLGTPLWAIIDGFYRTGALVFGGGHVVLPLLQAEVVPPGWVDTQTFLAGYGAVQAVPGPIFSFGAYLGVSISLGAGDTAVTATLIGLIAVVALFAASLLSVWGALPYWHALARNTTAQGALSGINAVVVGLLFAAAYDPLWVSAIQGPRDIVLLIVVFAALAYWRMPAWAVVPMAAALAWGLPTW